MIFFQYWVSFFSSILLLYSVINFLYFFGSTEWVIIDFFNFNQTKLNNTLSLFFNSIILVTFFIGFFLKIGFTPVHLFKIEVYKGLPFISIFFYTTYYFLVFFLILVLIINTNFYFTTLNI
jgi:NADH:ubiquinone oxidoreductase subunit 2 (subunit N)